MIDFIDMDERRNNRSVEKKLKDCLKNDRARIQVGRISPFGLLGDVTPAHPHGRARIVLGAVPPIAEATGFVRAVPSVALQVLRSVEETLLRSSRP